MNKQQLANRIWASANKMRSKIDPSEYKDYILGLVFYKFLSDTELKYFIKDCGWKEDELVELVENYDDPNMKIVIEECQRSIGFFIEYKYLFNTWLTDKRFSVAILSEALSNFERLMNDKFASVYGGIFKTLREGLSKLGENPAAQTKALNEIIKLIKDIPTDGSQDYDVLGYVYEFLISNFAANAGKKAGEFYTPHEVAMVMSEIVAEHHKDKEALEIYDPTSGSGSLLITIGKAVSKHIKDKNKVKYYAQELKNNTYNLTRMNLVMRGIIPQNIITRCADSLEEDWPLYADDSEIPQPLAVDAVVSNPPYSHPWDSVNKETDARFRQYGLAPKTKADYAFLLHELYHLKPDGILTIVLPHGVLFRGGSEQQIRANLIEKNNIDAIIGLPANIFFGTGIPTLIMVLKKNRGNEGVLIIDASKGFVKDGKQNKLRACDVKKIADTYRDRKKIEGYSREVSRDEIRKNDYNLNIPRYVDSSDAAEKYDIYSIMFGGIPDTEIADLHEYWEAFPSLCGELFEPEADKPYSNLKVEEVKTVVEQNEQVKLFKSHFIDVFKDFGEALHHKLIDNLMQVHDLQTMNEITSDIFRRFADTLLLDKYDAYQMFFDKWQTIIGDIETIQQEGIEAARMIETAYKIKKKNDEEIEVPDGLKGRIIPFEIVQNDRFQTELEALSSLSSRLEAIESELDEVRDSFTDEELDKYCDSDKDNAFDKKKITADAKPKADTEAETKVKLQQIVALWTEKKKTENQIKTDKKLLEEKTIEEIKHLSEEEVAYFLHLKWIKPVVSAINAMPDAVILKLTDAVNELEKKYAVTYNSIEEELSSSQQTLSDLVSQLTGDEFAIKGLEILTNKED